MSVECTMEKIDTLIEVFNARSYYCFKVAETDKAHFFDNEKYYKRRIGKYEVKYFSMVSTSLRQKITCQMRN